MNFHCNSLCRWTIYNCVFTFCFQFSDQPALLICHWIDLHLQWYHHMRRLSVPRLTERMFGQRPLRMNAKFFWYQSSIFEPLICVFPLPISPSVYFLRQKTEIRQRGIKPFAIEPQAFNFLLATPQGKMVWYNKHKILILNWTFQNQILNIY